MSYYNQQQPPVGVPPPQGNQIKLLQFDLHVFFKKTFCFWGWDDGFVDIFDDDRLSSGGVS